MDIKEFETLLKRSHHFADVINTHRKATAQIIALLVIELVRTGKFTPSEAHTMLNRWESSTGFPSIDGERGLLIGKIRDAIKGI